MPDQTLTHLTAAAPLAVGGLLVLLSPIYDRFIEWGAKREFGGNRYLETGENHTPVRLITQYTSWALDVAQAGTLVLGPLVGLVAALGGGTTKGVVGWIYFGFVIVGVVIFGLTAGVDKPCVYGKTRYGYSRGGKLLFGWTAVSIAAIVLYLGASVAAYVV